MMILSLRITGKPGDNFTVNTGRFNGGTGKGSKELLVISCLVLVPKNQIASRACDSYCGSTNLSSHFKAQESRPPACLTTSPLRIPNIYILLHAVHFQGLWMVAATASASGVDGLEEDVAIDSRLIPLSEQARVEHACQECLQWHR